VRFINDTMMVSRSGAVECSAKIATRTLPDISATTRLLRDRAGYGAIFSDCAQSQFLDQESVQEEAHSRIITTARPRERFIVFEQWKAIHIDSGRGGQSMVAQTRLW
jgi:hypothetical protein